MTRALVVEAPDRGRVLVVAARLVGAALLGTMAGIHVYLWQTGYRDIPTIGPLFLLNGVLGALLALALPAVPRRWLGVASLAGAGLAAGTLGALVLSLTRGVFGFQESTRAPLVTPTIATEAAAAVLLAALAAADLLPFLAARRQRRRRT